MVSNQHYIEIYVNGNLLELGSQESLNLRLNNVLFDPAKTSTTQAEYSFSFDIPDTPNNSKAFDFANNLSKINKFRTRYACEVYADGDLIFNGSLSIQKYSAKDRVYSCNLVNIKINSLEEIFGDAVMTDIPWMVDFSGASSINSVNNDATSKYYFPLVSYGAFQKNYIDKDEVSANYTSKFDMDKYNKWWVESFYPSLNVMESIKKAYEWKGYNVGGSAFSDPQIANVYASCNLASEQSPNYNVGNPLFGDLNLTCSWNNYVGSGSTPQELKFPYLEVKPAINASNANDESRYNLSEINFWNMCDSTTNPNVSVTLHHDTYMYDPTEHLFVVPADGWYKIDLTVNASLSGSNSTFNAKQWTTTFNQGDEFTKRQVSIRRTLLEHTPIEIQLIKNYDDNIELIKGKRNIVYATGDPNQTTYRYRGGSYTATTEYQNKSEWLTEYPHENLAGSTSPTKTEGLIVSATSSRKGGWTATEQKASGTFGGGNRTSTIVASTANSLGYMHRDGYVMPYDQVVSPAFICGFSSLDNGVVSVAKNGDSWSKMCSISNKIFANVKGLDLISNNSSSATTYCQNEYSGSQCTVSASTSGLSGTVQCCVYLYKNDVLELVAIQRSFDDSGFGINSMSNQGYACSATCSLHITGMNDKTYETLKSDPLWNYYSNPTFPSKLNLFNFTNSETKISDWISNVQKAFNLEITTNGNIVNIETNKGIKKSINHAVDIDDRVSSSEAEAEYISYPREMSVRYKIDTDEWGFEKSVPPDKIDADDWKDYGDSGYTVIKLNDDTYETSTQNTSTNFSYTWYDNFNWKEVTSGGTETGLRQTITIPVIEKAEYMADGYGYEEAMKHDGYSLSQRFWYREHLSNQYVWLSSIKSNGSKERVYLCYPSNIRDSFNLSYKDTEKSIVTEYFNIHPMLSSNYVNIEVYLSPQEYDLIKGGSLVHFDDDLYFVSEIQGYDPTGTNPTELKLIKKP